MFSFGASPIELTPLVAKLDAPRSGSGCAQSCGAVCTHATVAERHMLCLKQEVLDDKVRTNDDGLGASNTS